jgi:hypothetical protein
MVVNIRWLRNLPINSVVAAKADFPAHTRRVIKHWGKLLRSAYANDAGKSAVLSSIRLPLFGPPPSSPSITEHSLHGINTSGKAKSVTQSPVQNVTYVSGRSQPPARPYQAGEDGALAWH